MSKPRMVQSLHDSLRGDAVRGMLIDMIENVEGLEEAGQQEVKALLDRQIDHILESVDDLVLDGDDSEVLTILPILWLELRFRWNRLNAQMQYQSAVKGAANPRTMAEGGVTSFLAGAIEDCLTNRDAFWLYKVAHDPIGSLSKASRMIDRTMQLVCHAEVGVQQIVEKLSEMRGVVVGSMADTILARQVDEALASSLSTIAEHIVVQVPDIHRSLEVLMVDALTESPVTGVLTDACENSQTGIQPDIVRSFLLVAEKWFSLLFGLSVEKTKSERIESGKAAHVNVFWSASNDPLHATFTLRDDGLGRPIEPHLLCSEGTSGIEVTVNSNYPNGAELRVQVDKALYGLNSYFVVSNQQGPFGAGFAVPARMVKLILKPEQVLVDWDSGTVVIEDTVRHPIFTLSQLLGEPEVTTESRIFLLLDDEEVGAMCLAVPFLRSMLNNRMRTNPIKKVAKALSGLVLVDGRCFPVLNFPWLLESLSVSEDPHESLAQNTPGSSETVNRLG